MIRLVELLATIEGVVVVTIVALTTIRRLYGHHREARYERLLERYRDPVIEFVATEGAHAPEPLRRLAGGDARAAVGELLALYAGAVRGEATERIGAFLDIQGYVDSSIAELRRSRRGWRRGRAALTLGDFGAREALVPLRRALLEDPSAEVRLAAARSLGRLRDPRAAASLLDAAARDLVPTAAAAQALIDIGEPALPALLEAVGSAHEDMRRSGCRIAGLLGAGDADAARVLHERAMLDESAAVRAAACEALGHTGGDEAGIALAMAASDVEPAVRAAACRAAEELQLSEFAGQLEALLADEATDVQRAAARVAVAIGHDGAGSRFLAEARADRTWELR